VDIMTITHCSHDNRSSSGNNPA